MVDIMTIQTVCNQLHKSISAEQVFCSIVTQMEYLPQFKSQPSLKIVHEQNYETSYHRNTAAGNLGRLLSTGEYDELLLLMTIECFVEARRHDKTAETALQGVTVSNPADEQLMIMAIKYHKRRRQKLHLAVTTLRAAVGPELWEKGKKLAE